MNREEIRGILPHREPMLLIDEVFIGEDTQAHGRVTVRGDEWFLQGHFPGNPIVPGVILCEMMAQTCCVLFDKREENELYFFTGLDKIRFKKNVVPGDIIEFTCSIVKSKGPFYFAKGQGTVDGKVCVTGEFSFAMVKA